MSKWFQIYILHQLGRTKICLKRKPNMVPNYYSSSSSSSFFFFQTKDDSSYSVLRKKTETGYLSDSNFWMVLVAWFRTTVLGGPSFNGSYNPFRFALFLGLGFLRDFNSENIKRAFLIIYSFFLFVSYNYI